MADSQTTPTTSRTPSLVGGVTTSQSMPDISSWNGIKMPTQSTPGSANSGDSIIGLYGLPTPSTSLSRPASVAPSCVSSAQKKNEDLQMEADINKAMVQEVQDQMQCLQRAFDTNKEFQAVSQTSLRVRGEQIEQLRGELEKCNEQIDAYRHDVALLTQTLQTQADELIAKEAEIQVLKLSTTVDIPKVGSSVQENGFLIEKINKLKGENLVQDAKMTRLATCISSLQEQLVEITTNRNNIRKELKDSEKRFRTLLHEKDAADEALEYEQQCNSELRDLHNINKMKSQLDQQAARITRDAHVIEAKDQKLQLAETCETMQKQEITGLRAELAAVKNEKGHLQKFSQEAQAKIAEQGIMIQNFRKQLACAIARPGGTDMVFREQLERAVQAERQALEKHIKQKNDHIALLEMSKRKGKGTFTTQQLDCAVQDERHRLESHIKKQQDQITRLEKSKEKHEGKATKEQLENVVQAERRRLESKMRKQQQDHDAQIEKYNVKNKGKLTEEDLEKAVQTERHKFETHFKHAVTREQMDQAVKAERAEHRRFEVRILEQNKEIATLKAKLQESRREGDSSNSQSRLRSRHPLKNQSSSSRYDAAPHGSRHEPKRNPRDKSNLESRHGSQHQNTKTATQKPLANLPLSPPSSSTPITPSHPAHLTPTDLQTRLITLESTLNTERTQATNRLALATQDFEAKYAAQEARMRKCYQHIRDVEGRCREAEAELQAKPAQTPAQAQVQEQVNGKGVKPDLIEQTESLALKLELEQAKAELATCTAQLAKAKKDGKRYRTAFYEMESELYVETADLNKKEDQVRVLKGLLASVGVEVEGSDGE